MAYPEYLRLRARELRVEKRLMQAKYQRLREEAYAQGAAEYAVQYHADQDLDALRSYWGEMLGIDSSVIKVLRKSNSSKLKQRIWRSEFGVLTVRTNDTYLRARLQAWIDLVKGGW
jgi:hypothetical protein